MLLCNAEPVSYRGESDHSDGSRMNRGRSATVYLNDDIMVTNGLGQDTALLISNNDDEGSSDAADATEVPADTDDILYQYEQDYSPNQATDPVREMESPIVVGNDEEHICHRKRLAYDKSSRNKLIIVSVCCLLFMSVEIVGGRLSNSLALISDATHLASDMIGFLISLFAIWIAQRSPSLTLSFGYYRAEILGAIVSVMIIWGATIGLVYFALQRLLHSEYEIKPNEMLITAALGIFFNILMGTVLHVKTCGCDSIGHIHSHGGASHSHSNINVRAALVHVIGDLVQSIGVFIAAIIIKFKPHLKIVDPVCTFIFSFLVFLTTVSVFRDAILVIMEAVPPTVSLKAVKEDLESIAHIEGIHSLHIWALTTNQFAMTAHLAITPSIYQTEHQDILKEATKLLHKRYSILHCTIQVEKYSPAMENCFQCNEMKEC